MKRFVTYIALLLAFVLSLSACNKSSSNNNENIGAKLAESSTLNSILKNKKLRVCTDPGYEPFEMRNKNNDIIGFDIDLSREMATAMGVELVIVPVAFDGLISALFTDKCDIVLAGMTINATRNLQVNFADPYLHIGQTVLINKKIADKVKSYKDLNSADYTIATRLGVTGDFVVAEKMPKAKVKRFEAENEALIEVVNGQADAFVYDFPLLASFYTDYPDKLVHLDTPFTYEPLGFAIRKGDPDFLNWLNNWIAQIKGDGTFDKYYSYWFEENEWKKALR